MQQRSTFCALDIQQRALPPDHPEYRETLNNLGTLYLARGKPEQARKYLEAGCRPQTPALNSSRRVPGRLCCCLRCSVALLPPNPRSFDTGTRCFATRRRSEIASLYNLGMAYANQGHFSEAFAYGIKAAAFELVNIGQVFSTATESGDLTYLWDLRAKLDGSLSLVFGSLFTPFVKRTALDLVLKNKGGRFPCAAAKEAACASRTVRDRRCRLEQAARTDVADHH